MTNELLKKIVYGGIEIPFISDGGNSAMINATKMAQCFPGKRLDNFLANQTTKDYISSLSRITGKSVSELIVAKKGGNDRNNQGTWMNKNLALEFARWLSPGFAVWCNRKIRELLTNGAATLEDEDNQLQQSNDRFQQDCQQMKPYADYSYSVLAYSKMTYSTTEIIKGFSCRISVREVFARLEKEGYIGRSGNSKNWSLKAPYDQSGCTRLVSNVVYSKDGQSSHTVSQERWTERGRSFLRSILLGWGVIPAAGNP